MGEPKWTLKKKSIYLCLVALGFHCCQWAFSSCDVWGLLCCGAQASPCGDFSCWGAQSLEWEGFGSCGTQAELLRGMWNLPRPGMEPVSPVLAKNFLSTVPPRKSPNKFFGQPNNYLEEVQTPLIVLGFPGGSEVKKKNLLAMQMT